MVNKGTLWLKKDYHWLICLILLGGILVRFVGLGEYPAGAHQDEVYSGYEAYALLNEGVGIPMVMHIRYILFHGDME